MWVWQSGPRSAQTTLVLAGLHHVSSLLASQLPGFEEAWSSSFLPYLIDGVLDMLSRYLPCIGVGCGRGPYS
jgi:hypothetical protein